MRILLVCAAGMSTSMLVTKMQKAAAEKGIEAEILAMPLQAAKPELDTWDVVLLGPQVRYCLKEAQDAVTDTPVDVIDMKDYGTMNGEKVLNKALELLGK